MGNKKHCPESLTHKTHMCQLKNKGMMEEIARRTSFRTVVCAKCGVEVNNADYVCYPRPL